MNRIFTYIFLSISSIICYALPARQGVLQALQPDGITVNIRMEGNGEHKRIFSEDGYLLTTDSLGFYVYADTDQEGNVTPSAIRALESDKKDSGILNKISHLHQIGLTESYRVRESEEDISKYAKGIGLGVTKFPSYGEHRSVVILVEFADKGFTIENPNDF